MRTSLIFLLFLVFSIHGIVPEYCDDSGFLERLFGVAIDCEACDDEGNCLGRPQTISSHSLYGGKCQVNFKKDKKGNCRRLLARARPRIA